MFNYIVSLRQIDREMKRIIKQEFELVVAVKKEARDIHLTPSLDSSEEYNLLISEVIQNAEKMIKKLKSLQQPKRTK